jgi:hypothetical protein
MKSSVFWDVMLLEVNQCFGGKRHFHLWGSRVSKARNQVASKASLKMIISMLL